MRPGPDPGKDNAELRIKWALRVLKLSDNDLVGLHETRSDVPIRRAKNRAKAIVFLAQLDKQKLLNEQMRQANKVAELARLNA